MDFTLSPASMAALFLAMLVLAAVPSLSVLTVSARAAAHGFAHGAATTAGVVAGDLVFILLAIFGLALLAEALGDGFVWIRYLGAAWLLYLGLRLWRDRSRPAGLEGTGRASLRASFMAGLLLTLGDQKAILFYLGFFPAFLDLTALTLLDAGVVATIAILAVGGVKLAYAGAAVRLAAVLGARVGGVLKGLAALVLLAVGLFLLFGA
jgi:threonine/homoserine/homoserine lactone efflux protein